MPGETLGTALAVLLAIGGTAAADDIDALVFDFPGAPMVVVLDTMRDIERAPDGTVNFRLDTTDTETFARLTGASIGHIVSVTFRGAVVAEPTIRSGIYGGSGMIAEPSDAPLAAVAKLEDR